jgi:hypothetical protein
MSTSQDKIPVYQRNLRLGDTNIDYLSLEVDYDYPDEKPVGYLVPVEPEAQPGSGGTDGQRT